MSVRIRLRRMGRKKQPHYRVVVADGASPRDGRIVENLGYYKPQSSPARLVLDLDRFDYWVKQGAQPSDTVQSLAGKARRGGDRKVAIGEPDIEAQKKRETDALAARRTAERKQRESEAQAAAPTPATAEVAEVAPEPAAEDGDGGKEEAEPENASGSEA
jgi:small subunit ribosomal protein S16